MVKYSAGYRLCGQLLCSGRFDDHRSNEHQQFLLIVAHNTVAKQSPNYGHRAQQRCASGALIKVCLENAAEHKRLAIGNSNTRLHTIGVYRRHAIEYLAHGILFYLQRHNHAIIGSNLRHHL